MLNLHHGIRWIMYMEDFRNYRREISDSLVFRAATFDDEAAIAVILKAAAMNMIAQGKKQWDENYPTEIHVRSDIEKGCAYVLEEFGDIVGYAAVVFDGERAYESLTGEWINEGTYVVAHRVAVSMERQGKGLGRLLLKAIEDFARSEGADSFRIDTNFDNLIMLSLLDKERFIYCGEIKYEKGSRKAFEKRL